MLAERMRMSVGGIKTFDIQDAVVVNQAYDTSGNGGRKLVRLSNRWLVSVVKTTIPSLDFYVSKDNGKTWSLLTRNSGTRNWSAITSKGTMIYLLWHDSDNGNMRFTSFDATTIGSTFDMGNLLIGLGSFRGVSIAINDAGTEVHATWSGKGGSFPNSFNIQYVKGTINADGSVTLGTVEQITKLNTTGQDYKYPCIIVKDNSPYIFMEYANSGNKIIAAISPSLTGFDQYDGSYFGWSGEKVIYNGGASYIQSSPSAIFVPQSINGLANGRIWVAWHGTDSSNTTYTQPKMAYSDDGGTSWVVTPNLVTAGVNISNLTITVSKSNILYVAWMNSSGIVNVRQATYNGTTWSLVSKLDKNGSDPSSLVDLSLDFSSPLFIYKDYITPKVGFYGTWKSK